MMRLFVSESVCSGAWLEAFEDASLLGEARGMLLAALEDFSLAGRVQVSTTWDARLGACPVPNVEVVITRSAQEEQAAFSRLLSGADAVFVIAPEFHHLLATRCHDVLSAGKIWLGSTLEAGELFADKLATYEFCRRHNLATIATFTDNTRLPASRAFVHKPRFGAGSVETRVLASGEAAHASMVSPFGPMLWQPYLEGVSLSLGVVVRPLLGYNCNLEMRTTRRLKLPLIRPELCCDDARKVLAGHLLPQGEKGHEHHIDFFPLACQHLTSDGTLKYIGSTVPAQPQLQARAEELAQRLMNAAPGLQGYFGIDLLYIPTTDELLLVEVNPRLTTSYLAYRQLTSENLLARLLNTGDVTQSIRWHDKQVDLTLR